VDISGPRINADVTFYFGIDGKAEFRTNDQLNSPGLWDDMRMSTAMHRPWK